MSKKKNKGAVSYVAEKLNPGDYVTVKMMYTKDNKMYVWTGDNLLQYYDGSWSQSVSKMSLPNMLKKVL